MQSTINRTTKTGRLSLGSQIAEVIDCCNHCDLGNNVIDNRCVQVKPNVIKSKQVYLFVDEFPSDVERVLGEPLEGVVANPLKTMLNSFLPPEKIYVAYLNYCGTIYDKIIEHHRKACLPNLQFIIQTLEPISIFALGSKVSKFLTKSGITHTELPSKFGVYSSRLDHQRAYLILEQFFNKRNA